MLWHDKRLDELSELDEYSRDRATKEAEVIESPACGKPLLVGVTHATHTFDDDAN